MTRRRRLAHGSTTGAQALQCSAVRTVDAHLRVQEAAQALTCKLDEDSLPPPLGGSVEFDAEDSVVIAIDRARSRLTPTV